MARLRGSSTSAGACEGGGAARTGREPHRPGEQVREEPGHVEQEGALGLHAPEPLEDREGQELRVGEPLEGGVSPPVVGVEPVVGVVDEAEEDGYRLFPFERVVG